MYTKRQTVWLVSMLSLMVVLSAYYLFTEDVDKMGLSSDHVTLNEVKMDTKDVGKPADESPAKETSGKAQASSVSTGTSAKTDAAATAGTKSTEAQGAADSKKTDADVLKQVASQAKSGQDFFDTMQMKRTEDFSKQTENLYTIISDNKQKAEAQAKAHEELNKLQELEAKITSLEEKLTKDFAHVLVTQEANKVKVVVQANKLEKSQAVSIVDTAMQEMGVGPERIVVQYVH